MLVETETRSVNFSRSIALTQREVVYLCSLPKLYRCLNIEPRCAAIPFMFAALLDGWMFDLSFANVIKSLRRMPDLKLIFKLYLSKDIAVRIEHAK